MPKRYGTVLVFKEGASPEDIQKALDGLTGILDPDYHLDRQGTGTVPYRLESFDPENGGPAWYIP